MTRNVITHSFVLRSRAHHLALILLLTATVVCLGLDPDSSTKVLLPLHVCENSDGNTYPQGENPSEKDNHVSLDEDWAGVSWGAVRDNCSVRWLYDYRRAHRVSTDDHESPRPCKAADRTHRVT